MSLIESNLDIRQAPWSARALQIQWSSTRVRPGNMSSIATRERFVIAMELIARAEAIVEAWIETDTSRRSVFQRQRLGSSVIVENGMMHIDIVGPQFDRMVALSLSMHDRQLLFAQSSLLAQSGFGAGSVDPPTLALSNDQAAA